MKNPEGSRRPAPVWALAVILGVEALLVLAYFVTVVVDLFRGDASDVVNGIAWAVVAFVAVLWVGLCAVGTLLGRSFVRALAIVWQLLQIAIGVGCLEGYVGTAWAGWLLIVFGIAGFILVILPATNRALRGADGHDER